MIRRIWLLAALTGLTAACSAGTTTLPPGNPAPTRVSAGDCLRDDSSLAALPDGLAPVDAISAFLDSGGSPLDLGPALIENGWIPQGSAIIFTDLDGDSDPDLALGLVSPPPGGSLVVWRCDRGIFAHETLVGQGGGYGPPVVLEAVDLTGDGVADLVVDLPECGAHTCVPHPQVIVSGEDGPRSFAISPTDDLPSPEFEVRPAVPDRPGGIEIIAHGANSVGAGPYRKRTRSWAWDSEVPGFSVGGTTIEAPRFRIHLIHDADEAFLQADPATALEAYQRSIVDDGLLDWPSPGELRDALAGYAAYRRMLVFLAANDLASAQQEFEQRLRQASPEAAPFADLATALLAAFSDAGLAAGCREVIARVETDPTLYLTALNQGYVNRTYSPRDVCPVP